ncbi:MAG: hypothetical protein VCC67_18290 [Myxococcota bacterium]
MSEPSSSVHSIPTALVFAFSVVLFAPATVDANEARTLRFARHGELLASRSLSWMRAVSAPTAVRVFEPYEEDEVVFEAVSLETILDAVYTPSWRDRPDLLFVFRCSDGYEPTVPVGRALEHRAWLAFARERSGPVPSGQTGFTIYKLESGERKLIPLAPFYLIWDNLDDELLRAEGDYGWPYQLVGIDLARAEDRFPRMVPPATTSVYALEGFAAFRVHCSRCHAIDGEGGTIGPDLQAPVNITRVRSREWLQRWIADPSQILPTSRMPRFQRKVPTPSRVIDQIIAYLSALAERNPAAPAEPNLDAH